MTDDELLTALIDLATNITNLHKRQIAIAAYGRLHELIVMPAPPTPPPPGSVAVRIAVAVDEQGQVTAYPIFADYTDTERTSDARESLCGPLANEGIITAHIPLRVVPEVSATVEPFDPEATT